MSAITTAKRDFLAVRRSKMIWFVVGIYALLMGMLFYWERNNPAQNAVEYPLMGMAGLGAFVLPLVALVAAYLAIAGERESGAIRYALSMPTSRTDFVLGKYLSRAAIVGGAVAFAFTIGVALAVLWFSTVPLVLFGQVFVLTVAYALAYVSVAVTISALTGSRSRAMGGAIAFYMVTVVLLMFQYSLGRLFGWVTNSALSLDVSTSGVEFVEAITSPTVLYFRSLDWVVEEDTNPPGAGQESVWYLEPELMAALLCAWIVVPIALACWQFNRTEMS
ncbi:ABC transporter permease [Halovivax gelatinilyticus]|uniref:ABC transporter permease n=1 Tax=Halovivax gelatinilyticus TaxID=2961597 RepID=UPI0020CA940C|nr:ABC transporter permease subunit [Halovivax gelatinilyticus]